jgi:hypothetical protein
VKWCGWPIADTINPSKTKARPRPSTHRGFLTSLLCLRSILAPFLATRLRLNFLQVRSLMPLFLISLCQRLLMTRLCLTLVTRVVRCWSGNDSKMWRGICGGTRRLSSESLLCVSILVLGSSGRTLDGDSILMFRFEILVVLCRVRFLSSNDKNNNLHLRSSTGS